jgi:hypothetical protein
LLVRLVLVKTRTPPVVPVRFTWETVGFGDMGKLRLPMVMVVLLPMSKFTEVADPETLTSFPKTASPPGERMERMPAL